MTDKYEGEALSVCARQLQVSAGSYVFTVADVEAALRSARAEAFEEAAAIAESTPDSGICTMDDVENDHAHKIAAAIRAALQVGPGDELHQIRYVKTYINELKDKLAAETAARKQAVILLRDAWLPLRHTHALYVEQSAALLEEKLAALEPTPSAPTPAVVEKRDMFHCPAHGGYGFMNDCVTCKESAPRPIDGETPDEGATK